MVFRQLLRGELPVGVPLGDRVASRHPYHGKVGLEPGKAPKPSADFGCCSTAWPYHATIFGGSLVLSFIVTIIILTFWTRRLRAGRMKI